MKMFVYGTLKRGYGNNRFLRNCEFLGVAISTEASYHMCGLGIPFLMEGGNKMVKGELWEVNDEALPAIDRLESGYRRRERTFLNVDTEEVVSAWVYLLEGQGFGMENDGKVLEWPFSTADDALETMAPSRTSPGFERIKKNSSYNGMVESTLAAQKKALEDAGSSRR